MKENFVVGKTDEFNEQKATSQVLLTNCFSLESVLAIHADH